MAVNLILLRCIHIKLIFDLRFVCLCVFLLFFYRYNSLNSVPFKRAFKSLNRICDITKNEFVISKNRLDLLISQNRICDITNSIL